jgi:hypothetical protein
MLLFLLALMMGAVIAPIVWMFWSTLKEGARFDALRERDREDSERAVRRWADHERRMNELRERRWADHVRRMNERRERRWADHERRLNELRERVRGDA